MNIFSHYADLVRTAIRELHPGDEVSADLLQRCVVEPPRDSAHGDLATNAAMVLAKPLKTNPRALAEQLAARLADNDDIVSAEVAGPGFINLRLAEGVWAKVVAAILAAGSDFGRSTMGGGLKVNVEYVSANPTGPMHVGHCRGAVVGDALASLLDFAGYDVTREYYINDAGSQVDTLASSAFLRYREALGEDIGAIPEGLYPGDYLVPVGQMLVEKYADRLLAMDERERMVLVKDATIDAMMDLIRADLALLNVRHEVFFSERTLHARDGANSSQIDRMLEELRSRDLVYEGTLPPPKGQLPEDWEDREQTLFRATAFGDDIDRALKKSDGSYTYFAADVAYFLSKYERGFKEMIFILGADHGGYVKRLEAVGAPFRRVRPR